MDSQNDKALDTLQMKAKRALTDISNQEDFRPKEWLVRSRVKAKKKSYDQNSSILPQISSQKVSLKYPLKSSAFLARRKNNIYKQRMSQILDRTQASKQLPNYNINHKFAQEMRSINQSKILGAHISILKNKQNTPLRSQTQQNQEKQSQESQIMSFLKSRGTQSEQQIKSNWSVHVKKSLTGMSRINQKVSKEIQQIKELICDKRIKCRKLSKQGYLIVKRDSLENLHDQYPHCIQSMQLKHKSIQKVKNRYEPFAKSTLNNRLNEQQTFKNNQNSVSKHFLRNALEILHMKHNFNFSHDKSLTLSDSKSKFQQ